MDTLTCTVTRLLPPAEWPRLAGTEAEALWPLLDPAKAQIIVIEQDGVIVGCWTLMQVLHAECLWVAPSARKRGVVFRHLLSFLRRTASAAGFTTVATAASSDEVRRLLDRFGAVRVPGDPYVFRVDQLPKEQEPCR